MARRFFVKLRPPGDAWYVVRDRNDPNLWNLATAPPQALSMDEAERLRVLACQSLADRVEVVPAF